MQDLIRKRPGVISTRVGYTGGDVPNATYRNHGTHAEAIEITFDPDQTQLPGPAGVLLPDPRPDHQEPPGQRHRGQLPLGDLLHERRAEARRRGHDRRRRRLGPVAGQGRHRGRAGRAVLGGRAGAPGLPGAVPERLHLPLPPAGLEAAAPRGHGHPVTTGRRPASSTRRPAGTGQPVPGGPVVSSGAGPLSRASPLSRGQSLIRGRSLSIRGRSLIPPRGGCGRAHRRRMSPARRPGSARPCASPRPGRRPAPGWRRAGR